MKNLISRKFTNTRKMKLPLGGLIVIAVGLWLSGCATTMNPKEWDQARAPQLFENGQKQLLEGRFDKALDSFLLSKEASNKGGDKLLEGKSLHFIGLIYRVWGQPEKALEQFNQANLLLGEDSFKVANLTTLGEAYGTIGENSTSLNYYKQALDLGITLESKITDPNLQAFIAQALKGMALIYKADGDVIQTEKLLSQAMERFQRAVDKKGEIETLIQLSSLQQTLGQQNTAWENMQKALALVESYDFPWDLNTYVFLLDNVGKGYFNRGRYIDAASYFFKAIEIKERLRTTARGEVRRNYLAEQIKTYNDLSLALLRSGQTKNSLNVMGLSRGKVLAESLADTSHLERGFVLDQIQNTLKDNQAILVYGGADHNNLYLILVTHEAVTGKELPSKKILGEPFNKYGPFYNSLPSELRGIKIKTQISVSAGVERDKENLERLLTYYRSLLQSPDPKNLAPIRQIGQALYNLLIQPQEEYLKDKTDLLILPDGVLYFLPFETLVDPEDRYLVETRNVTYIQSLGVLNLLNQRQYSYDRKPLMALGGAVYNQTAPQEIDQTEIKLAKLRNQVDSAIRGNQLVGKAYQSLGLSKWKNLPGTLREVKNISHVVPGSRLIFGEEVSEQKVKQLSQSGELAQYKVVHFATHGLISPQIPELSALVLSQTEDGSGKEDGYLRMGEIANLKFNADFVNLSACETGLGRLYGGEGVVGLTQSFLLAGANGVSASLWPVEDQSTSDFMTGVYSLVEENHLSHADAITEIKRAFIKGQSSKSTGGKARGIQVVPVGQNYSHPYYWAPFAYYGNGNWSNLKGGLETLATVQSVDKRWNMVILKLNSGARLAEEAQVIALGSSGPVLLTVKKVNNDLVSAYPNNEGELEGLNLGVPVVSQQESFFEFEISLAQARRNNLEQRREWICAEWEKLNLEVEKHCQPSIKDTIYFNAMYYGWGLLQLSSAINPLGALDALQGVYTLGNVTNPGRDVASLKEVSCRMQKLPIKPGFCKKNIIPTTNHSP
ncbi:hypothetical protein UR09_06220 [Candidatus Nitromaritima sp. SCGC AAA799-A02]|nr:hypothetical protein UR09_06220 [Candidatus Nitromaritima sp. SCGC AAA799-A02]